MVKALVVGATGVAGTAGIAALRQRYGSKVEITGIWYARSETEMEITGVDRLLFGDISDPELHNEIANSVGEEFEWCLYATALGDVGFPIDEASSEQIAASNRLSYDPLLVLEQRFNLKHIVAYSTFYSLEHQKITYGAMGHSKHAIEQWAVSGAGERRICLRAGAFRSASSQGIKLLVRRRAKELANSSNPLLRQFFAGQKPSAAVDNLETAVFAEERDIYGDSETGPEGLQAAHMAIFAQPDCIFMNVCGTKVWPSSEAQSLD